jgi:transcriptional regulator with XRE-family HTH domain
MDDETLVREVMEVKNWTQKDVADYLGVDKSQMTRVLNYGQSLHPSSRKLLNMLLEEEKEYS